MTVQLSSLIMSPRGCHDDLKSLFHLPDPPLRRFVSLFWTVADRQLASTAADGYHDTGAPMLAGGRIWCVRCLHPHVRRSAPLLPMDEKSYTVR